MKKQLLLPFLLFFGSGILHAQTPNVCLGDDLFPAGQCADACLYNCNIDGFSGNTSGFQGDPDNTFCGTLETTQWFAFYASAEHVTITALPSLCVYGNGIQLALYSDCNGAPIPGGCNTGASGGGSTPVSISVDLVPGQVYYLMVDGYAGDLCDYTFNVTPAQAFGEYVKKTVLDLCPNETVSLDGQDYSAPDTVVLHSVAASGCDSLRIFYLHKKEKAVVQKHLSFCPGESFTLNGTVYYQEAIVADTIFNPAGCDTVTVYNLHYLLDPAACPSCSETFLKRIGSPGMQVRGYGVYKAGDGNLYVTGTVQDSALIMKIYPGGGIIWRRSFKIVPGLPDNIADLLEDSDGMIVGCGQSGDLQPGLTGFAFRYDPVADQMLWVQSFSEESPYVMGILEKGPGEDFVMYSNPHVPSNRAGLTEIRRSDGSYLPAPMSQRLHLGAADNFNSALVLNGNFYGVGRFTNGGSYTDMRHALSRIDLSNGDNTFTTLNHVPPGSPARLYGMDLVVEGLSIYSVSFGDDSGENLNNSHIFLHKTSLFGPLIWTKKIDLEDITAESVDEIVSVPDGFILYCRDLAATPGSDIYLVKTDKSGNLVWSKKIDFGNNENFSRVSTTQSQILVNGNYLYFTATTTDESGDSRMILAKTTLDATLDGDCDYISSTPASITDVPDPKTWAVSLTNELPTPTFLPSAPVLRPTDLAVENVCKVYVDKAITETLCPGQSIVIGGVTYTLPGVVLDTVAGLAGCDTIITYTLISVPKPTKTENIAFCPGDAFVIQGISYNEPGTIIVSLPSPTGCDTLATFVLSFLPQPARTETILLQQGGSVVIGGIVYNTEGTVVDTIPASTGCDTIVTYTLIFDNTIPDTCMAAAGFLKKYGEQGKQARGNVLCVSADGNLYVAGEKDLECLLMKVTPSGGVLWSRVFRPDPLLTTHLSDLVEDSDGMLAGCGVIGEGDFNLKSFAFRYNPLTDNLIWSKKLEKESPEAYRILEQGPGGNFLLLTSPQIALDVDDAEMWELDRNTGALAGGLTRRYDFGISDVFNGMVIHDGAIYATGRHIPGFNPGVTTAKVRMGLSKIDLATGIPVWSRLSHVDTGKVAAFYGQDLLVNGNSVMALYSGSGTSDLSINKSMFLQKTSVDGDLLWVKRYHLPGASGIESNQILQWSGGYLLLGRLYLTGSEWRMLIVKTDFDGQIIWAKSLPISLFSGVISNNLHGCQHLGSVAGDVLYLTGTTGNFPTDIFIMKMTSDGEAGDSCSFVSPVDLMTETVQDPVNIPINLNFGQVIGQLTNVAAPFSPALMPAATLCVRCSCPDTLDLGPDLVQCKPEPVTLDAGSNFVSYLWQDGSTAATNIAAVPGLYWVEVRDACGKTFRDSVSLAVPNTSVTINCMADIAVATQPGTGPVVVQYALPTASSDCSCPGIGLTITEGLPSGSLFPVTTTKVCYEAVDSCGNTASCCFKVTVREEEPCDEKEIGCMKYELLSITKGAGTDLTYEIRVTNNCAGKMIYTAIQMPNGVTAVTPLNNSVFTAPGGRTYDVRNPNYTPFYSIRFKSQTDSISNGQSDVFKYTLPGQTKPDYIHITSRLYPQLFYEAYLNTFNCQVKQSSGNKPAGVADRDMMNAADAQEVRVFPNPTSGELFADLSAWKGSRVTIRIYNSLGQRVHERILEVSGEPQAIGLAKNLENGLYFLQATTDDGRKSAARFVKQNE